ncbi:hypothetical protein AB5J72_41600 [Streptomyces sp. CG1]|uniref:hypothetical protein n=1 Tax=Streptomyces sp. CG1 TaxID=1287523 RepID=UPI0034E2FAE2
MPVQDNLRAAKPALALPVAGHVRGGDGEVPGRIRCGLPVDGVIQCGVERLSVRDDGVVGFSARVWTWPVAVPSTRRPASAAGLAASALAAAVGGAAFFAEEFTDPDTALEPLHDHGHGNSHGHESGTDDHHGSAHGDFFEEI